MPGTGPEMSEALAMTILSSVMPVWFLNPSQLAASLPPSAALVPPP